MLSDRFRLADRIAACLFDLDGVVPPTAGVQAARKRTVDALLGRDGAAASSLSPAGKTAPSFSLEAARSPGVRPAHPEVSENSLADVPTGRAGQFGMVVGVDRAGHRDELRASADVVVEDVIEPVSEP